MSSITTDIMPFDIRTRAVLLAALCCSVVYAAPLAAQTPPAQTAPPPFRLSEGQILSLLQNLPPESGRPIGALINGLLSDTTSHMQMAARRPATRADTLRAAAVVKAMRASLAPYKDVAAAERDGYVRFLPWLEQTVYHFNSVANYQAATAGFDASKPVSLLYRKDEQGKMVLMGAMYTAPAASTPAELDARLPLGIAYWHQHVNFCARRPTQEEVRAARPDSALVARSLQIVTAEACAAEGGMFIPQLFGWMAHVNAFDGDNVDAIWGEEGKDHMARHGHKHGPDLPQ